MKYHDCESVRRSVSSYIDGTLASKDAAAFRIHVAACSHCETVLEDSLAACRAVRSLPRLRVPAALTTSLRVIGSRERVRRNRWRSWATVADGCWGDACLWFNNLMRPLALPFAGGLMAASLTFSMFISVYPLTGQALDYDVPIWPKEPNPYREATIRNMAPLEFNGTEVSVDLVINDQGRVLDYSFANGAHGSNPAVRRTVENILLFTEFNPAMASGQRVSGKVRISFKPSSQLNVRG